MARDDGDQFGTPIQEADQLEQEHSGLVRANPDGRS